MKFLITLLTASFLISCTATGPAKDQDDIEKEDVMDFGKIIFWKRNNANDTATASSTERTSQSPTSVNARPIDSERIPDNIVNMHEYDAYQLWLRERDANSSSYQEFKEYQEYKKWLKLKSSQ
jgi:hypothetical protein